ncbi:INSYN2B protein-like [Phasianus colchicus]|uniref:INSYN2B protein-like n=1 Tax=Phasianus colchicus TaxID=9054 RepID=UPI00129DCA8A|nr:INSYN2B protein-like [Phasianus colchicus]
MLSRDPVPSGEGGQEKAMTVRSVLLNRDSPDIESRLQRRRNRTQQVRFKDLVEGSSPPAPAPGPNTPRASPPPRAPPEPAALCASRRSWPQAQPCSLTLPMPGKSCASAAIQTSPSLQKPFPAPRPHSRSVCDVAVDTGLLAALGSARCPGGAAPTASTRAVPPQTPAAERAPSLAPHPAACRVPPPPPRDPRPPHPGTAGCPAASCTPSARSCSAEPCARPGGTPRGGRGPPQRPASVPCAQSQPSSELWVLGRSDSEHSLPRGHRQPPLLHQPAQGNPPRDPSPPRHRLCGSPWGRPCCTPAPGWHSSATAALETTPAAPGHPDTQDICSQLRAAEPGHEQAAPERHKGPPHGVSTVVQPGGRTPEPPQHGQPCLSTQQSETLRHVQDLLQMVVAAKGTPGATAGDEHGHTSQGQGAQGDLQSQLQSLEGVLETSQQTIRVLLDVIQDLEKKEAQRDGRHSYRTGQDIANCGTCRDCACIIYSVEHDFRQQEGRFQRVLSHMEGDAAHSSPTPGPVPPARREPSPPAKLDAKKSRRKCFWFL